MPPSTISLLLLSIFTLAAADLSVTSHPSQLVLPPGIPISAAPAGRRNLTCNRIHIHGRSRLRHPSKYSHALKIRVSVSDPDSILRTPTPVEICFHRNASIELGTCPAEQWRKVSKGEWVQSVSPFEHRILDLRMPAEPSRIVEVSTEEEFLIHRVVFLFLGLVMMLAAHGLSESVVFYYGGAMTLGIIVVILMVLFQGMRLLPTGRKGSLAIFIYSSVVGVGAFLLSYLSGLVRTFLVELGISEDMHNPLGVLLLLCLVLAGAWFGYWGVRKLVLTEEGLVDSGVAYFVEWAILIFAAALIIESSLDTLFALEALFLSIIVLALTRAQRKSKFARRLFRPLRKIISRIEVPSVQSGYDDVPCYDHLHKTPSSQRSPVQKLNTPISGSTARLSQGSDKKIYFSTFHDTPDRKKFSKKEWEEFTREETQKGMKALVSSPEFNKWALANVDRLVVAPQTGERRSENRRGFFRWF